VPQRYADRGTEFHIDVACLALDLLPSWKRFFLKCCGEQRGVAFRKHHPHLYRIIKYLALAISFRQLFAAP
jgi:hypothetical protein